MAKKTELVTTKPDDIIEKFAAGYGMASAELVETMKRTLAVFRGRTTAP